MADYVDFDAAFPGLVIDDDTKQITNILKVRKADLVKSENCLYIYVQSHQWIHKKHLYRLEREIKRQLFPDFGFRVRIRENFNLSSQYNVLSYLDAYRPSIEYELAGMSPLMKQLYVNSAREMNGSSRLTIGLPDNMISEEYSEELEEYLREVINVRGGYDVQIATMLAKEDVQTEGEDEELVYDACLYAEYGPRKQSGSEYAEEPGKTYGEEYGKEYAKGDTEEAGKEDTEEAGTAAGKEPAAPEKNGKSAKGRGRKGRGKQAGASILTEAIADEAVPISELDENSGRVVIRGEIIALDVRELRNEKLLYAVSVTDFGDTINVKFFFTPEEAEQYKGVLKKGNTVKLRGRVAYDNYEKDINIASVYELAQIPSLRTVRTDNADRKRTELHCHTKMSNMDGVSDAAELIKTAYAMGHPAIAITDHGVVQSFPIAARAYGDVCKKYRSDYKNSHPGIDDAELKKVEVPFKVVYGCEIYLVDDLQKIVKGSDTRSFDREFVVFDIETTGFSPEYSKIIEIGAVKISEGKITGRFSKLIDPHIPVPLRIEQLTGINDSMLIGQPDIGEVLPEFLEFCKDAVLVAHNADFDCSFIKKNAEEQGYEYPFTSVDTLNLSRFLLPNLSRFKLDTVAKHLGVPLLKHHRAVDDAECTAGIFLKLAAKLAEKEIFDLKDLAEKGEFSPESVRHLPYYHAIVLIRNETGRVNLYRLISESHINYFNRRPRVPKSLLSKYREGLIIGSACAQGELFEAMIRNVSDEALVTIADFYDFLEVQPLGNNAFLMREQNYDHIRDEHDLQALNKKIIALGEQLMKPVVATGDVHFCNPEDSLIREMVMEGQGFNDAGCQPPLYLHTTEEMLEEFSYLDDRKAAEIVIDNPAKIAAMCDVISPTRPDKCPPVIENSDEDLRNSCFEEAHRLYGEKLPKIVEERLNKELNSIISNGYAVMYIIAQKLVKKSMSDGYLVGSRGSVGSSFAATMSGITEVNPLSPHYLCPECHYSDFDSEEVKAYGGRSGVDMPDKDCPVCGHRLNKLGFDIPFETFLGFKGNKEPDIDLNFSGEYQSQAHRYTEVIFGEGHTFRAGTISGLEDKKCYGYVKKYFDTKGIHKRGCEIDRLVQKMTGIRQTTGQHPGGIIVLPHGEEINSFTPVQHPANDTTTDIITTHFEYHSIDQNLLKLDILGHKDPTMIKMLEDLTGTKATEIPLDEPKVMSLFKSTEALGIRPEQIGGCRLGCLGVPEFGTEFVIQMLLDTKPQSMSDLIRISGLSHGTDVWLGNAKTLIQEGNATISTAICTRDDIMIYLISKGLESELSFTIMESVRKGKGLKPDWEEKMRAADVPEWYIWSCKKIKYMFPKAHAAAYVMMAYRVAWYKVYYPLEYYAAYYTIRASAFDYEKMCRGPERLKEHMDDFAARAAELTPKEGVMIKDMKIVREMYARGFEFMPIDIYKASAHRFTIHEGKIMPSIDAIDGFGGVAAEDVARAAAGGPFLSLDDFKDRSRVGESKTRKLAEIGILAGLPETNQLSLF